MLPAQFNALLDIARTPGTYQFAPSWAGPNIGSLLPWGQLAAMDVFNAAIGLAPALQQNSKSRNVGLIVGVTIASCAVVAIAIALGVFCVRRRTRLQESDPPSPFAENARHGLVSSRNQGFIEPFTSFPPEGTLTLSGSGPQHPREKNGRVASQTIDEVASSVIPPSSTAPPLPSTPNQTNAETTSQSVDPAAELVRRSSLNRIFNALFSANVRALREDDLEEPPEYDAH